MNRASDKYRSWLNIRFLPLVLLCAVIFLTAMTSPAAASLSENRTGLFLSSEAGSAGVEGGLNAGLHRVYSTFSYDFTPGSLVPKSLANSKTIRFTQDSIGTTFKDGRSVKSLIDGLKSGKISPNDLPPIRVFKKDGLTYTLDNRRLFATHQAGVKIKTVPATAKEIAKELPRKFTTPNQGTIIGIRGTLE